jgi:short-subunit dehydrogenase
MKALKVLVTGATSGIGRQTALRLAREGHRVFATGRRQGALDVLRAEAKGLPLETLALDVTSADSIAAAKTEIDRRTDGYGVDVLVNNAGYGLVGPLEEITDADLRRQYETNVFGLMAMTRAFVPQMRKRSSGRVINVSSVGGRMTFPMMGAYNSTKYAVESLSDALRNELSPFGVHVTLIEPGVIRTEFGDVALQTVAKYRSPESPYAAVLARADELERRSMAMASKPDVIALAISRAVRSRSPKARYVAPFRDHVMLTVVTSLPTRLVDAIMRALFGLTRKRLAPAAARTGGTASLTA